MKGLYTKIVLLVILFAFPGDYLCSQTPYFRTHQLIKGKRNYITHAILQDDNGYMWFGTTEGLILYDGLNYVIYTEQNGMAENNVTALCTDKDNTLWIGHQNGSITLYDGHKFTLFDPEEGLGTIPITSLLNSSDNNIWFATLGEGIYYYDRNRLYNLNTDDGLSDDYAYTILEGMDKRFYFGTDYGISIFNPEDKSFQKISMVDGLPDNIVKHLEQDSKGNIWIGTDEKGMVYYDIEKNKFIPIPDWNFGSVISFTLDKSDVWISTTSKGIVQMMINGNQSHRYNLITSDQGIVSNRTSSIFIDREKNVWIGTNQGVSQSVSTIFKFLNRKNGLPFDRINSVLVDNNDLIWICSESGLFKLTESKIGSYSVEKLFKGTELENAQLIDLYQDKFDYIWIGTYREGVIRLDPALHSYRKYTTKDGLPSNDIISVTGNSDVIQFSTLGGGISVCTINNNQVSFTNYDSDSGLGSNYVYATFIDSKNRTWVAKPDHELTYLENGKFYSKGEEDSVYFTTVYSFTEDVNGNIWFNTDDNGLYCYDNQKFINFNQTKGMTFEVINGIEIDDFNNILMASNDGIDIFNFSSKNLFHFGESYGVAYKDPVLNSIFKDHLGNIWIGTGDGLIIYNPYAYFQDTIHPRIFISSKQILYEEIEKGKTTFPHNKNHFTFNYTGLWYQDPEQLVFRYKLEGYDLDWLSATNSRQVTYSRIPPGSYTFRVEVSLDQINWIREDLSEFSFTIRPPFWRTAWFIISAIIIILAAIYLIFRIRLANLRRAKEELEQKVKEATEEIMEKNEELESQNTEIEAQRDVVMEQRDKISDQQEALQSSIRYASRIQTAVLPPEKLIDSLLDKYFILNKPRDIVSGDFYWVAEKDNYLFLAIADSTGHGVPGAFMSMLGTTAFYEVFNSCDKYESGKFLTNLREYVKKSLHHTGDDEDRYDGMDVAMCILYPDRSKLSFSGANNPLYLIRNKELLEIKGNKMPIGKHFRDNIPFTSEFMDIKEGDRIYMFSDGYPDQFGGEKGKKFKYQQLKDLLLEIHLEEMKKQKSILNETIENWKGGIYEQVDDIMIMGVQI